MVVITSEKVDPKKTHRSAHAVVSRCWHMLKQNSQLGCALPESAWLYVLVMKLFAEVGWPISKKARGKFNCTEDKRFTNLTGQGTAIWIIYCFQHWHRSSSPPYSFHMTSHVNSNSNSRNGWRSFPRKYSFLPVSTASGAYQNAIVRCTRCRVRCLTH